MAMLHCILYYSQNSRIQPHFFSVHMNGDPGGIFTVKMSLNVNVINAEKLLLLFKEHSKTFIFGTFLKIQARNNTASP